MWTTLARPFWPISCSVYINEQSSANSHSCIGCRPVACGIVMGKGFEYNWFTLRNRSYNFDSQSAVTCWLSANINSQLSLRAIFKSVSCSVFLSLQSFSASSVLFCRSSRSTKFRLSVCYTVGILYGVWNSCRLRIFASPSALQKVDGKCIAGNQNLDFDNYSCTVAYVRLTRGEHRCGGTVVGPWRLTRGHESDWKPVASPQDQSGSKTREKSGSPPTPSCYKNCVVHRR